MSTSLGETSAAPPATDISAKIKLTQESETLVHKKPPGVVKVSQFQATSERTIKDILEQEVLMASFTVDGAALVGTVLYSGQVNPAIISSSNYNTRLSYIAKLFYFWRGMIMVKAIFTKTILQQMKLALVFVPGATPQTKPPSKIDITMYSHKVIINPANDSEAILNIPFVSDRPFLPMSESTGMFYVILFQSFTASLEENNVVSCDLFVSSKSLEFHEFGLIPDTVLPDSGILDPEFTFLLLPVPTATQFQNPAAGTLACSYTTDAHVQATAPTHVGPVLTDIYPVRHPTAIGNAVTTNIGTGYNAQNSVTLYSRHGYHPTGSGFLRPVAFLMDVTTLPEYFIVEVYYNNDFVFFKPPATTNHIYGMLTPDLSNVSLDLTGIVELNALSVRINALQAILDRVLVVENHYSTCDCGEQCASESCCDFCFRCPSLCSGPRCDNVDSDDDSIVEYRAVVEGTECEDCGGVYASYTYGQAENLERGLCTCFPDDPVESSVLEVEDEVDGPEDNPCFMKTETCYKKCHKCGFGFHPNHLVESEGVAAGISLDEVLYVDSPSCHCLHHYCDSYAPLVSKNDLCCYTMAVLGGDERGFPCECPIISRECDRLFSFGFASSPQDIFGQPTALIALYFEKRDWKMWLTHVRTCVAAWFRDGSDWNVLIACLRIWYLYYRFENAICRNLSSDYMEAELRQVLSDVMHENVHDVRIPCSHQGLDRYVFLLEAATR